MTSTVEHRTEEKDGVDAVAKLDPAKVQPTKRTPGAFTPPSPAGSLDAVPA